jgi:predicted permease
MTKLIFNPYAFALGAGLFVASVHTGLPLHEVIEIVVDHLADTLL